MDQKKITIVLNGPYLVSGNAPLAEEKFVPDPVGGASVAYEKTKDFQAEESYALCRCGHSSNKPFCDGTHETVHFIGTEVASRAPYDEQAQHYVGKELDMLDNESLCAVARFCDHGKGAWEKVLNPSDEKMQQEGIYEACLCPSGRLTVVRKDGEKIEPPLEAEIIMLKDPAKKHLGPIYVKGGIEIESADGSVYEVRNRMTLCRCGESRNMPFCDASHLGCPHMEIADQ